MLDYCDRVTTYEILSAMLSDVKRCERYALFPLRSDGVQPVNLHLGRDLFRDRGAVVAAGDIKLETLGRAALVADLAGDPGSGLAVDVEQHHPRALAGIADCNGASRLFFVCFGLFRRLACGGIGRVKFAER